MFDNEQYKFLSRIVNNILEHKNLFHKSVIVLPNKQFELYFKKIFSKEGFQGILPKFQTIKELITDISELNELSGISLWIFSYKIYKKLYPLENFKSFLAWFPTFLNDWDEILEYAENDIKVIDFILSDKKNIVNEYYDVRRKNLDFWIKMKSFLPILKENLLNEHLGTKGIIYQTAKNNIEYFSEKTDNIFIFSLFNDLNPIEQNLIKNLLKLNKSLCFFHADEYYINNEIQESGKFIRNYLKWEEFSENSKFNWIYNDFIKKKNINVFEVSGDITQTKILPNILADLKNNTSKFSNTAIILLDENLILSTINSINGFIKNLDVNIGIPLNNLQFTNFIIKIFHLQKQLYNNPNSYYHLDIINVLNEICFTDKDLNLINKFTEYIKERNIIYISKEIVEELLKDLSYFELLVSYKNVQNYLEHLIIFCSKIKLRKNISNLEYKNISNIEDVFINLKIQLENYNFSVNIDILDILLNKLISTKSVNLKINSEDGIKIMKLSNAQGLSFENIIILSVNEGKLPIGKIQNTFLTDSIRQEFNMKTSLENDSKEAYNFYNLIQNSKNIYLLFNSISGGFNTGEKSRFITQLELESPHEVKNFIVDSSSEPIEKNTIKFKKTKNVLDKLEIWKQKISPSHINSYLYDPINFYIENILNIKNNNELEEELSSINFGNLVHIVLENIYKDFIGEKISYKKLIKIQKDVEKILEHVITKKLKHSLDYYNRGINYIHKEIALRTVNAIIQRDLDDIKNGNNIEIIALEKKISAEFHLNNEKQSEKVNFYGFIDRIDRFNENLRVIDYKTSKASDLSIKTENAFLFDSKYRQELQLSIYAYCLLNSKEFVDNEIQCGIWSFINPINGIKKLKILGEDIINKSNVEIPINTVKDIILEILNPDIDFTER